MDFSKNIEVKQGDLSVDLQGLIVDYQNVTFNILTLGWADQLLVQNLNSILEMQIQKKISISRNKYH